MLRARLAPRVRRLTVSGPEMSAAEYERSKGSLAEIDEAAEQIVYRPLYASSLGTAGFWLRYPARLRDLYREVRAAEVVHASTSHDLWRPMEFPALVFGRWLGRTTICVNDIDVRSNAWMNYRTGRWSRRSYLVCRYLYDPIRRLQLEWAARNCSLALLKGRKFAADFGRGRASVKDFLDSAFSAEHLIPPAALEAKIAALGDPARPLELVFFGRLTAYKGVDQCLRALAESVRLGGDGFRFTVIGAGEERENLEQLAAELGLGDRVRFTGPIRFGPALFEQLYRCHLLLAAPLSNDSPRSALDAFAAGLGIVAFDTEYYRDLAASGAVDLVPWPSASELGARIAEHCRNPRALADRLLRAVAFAAENTQEQWLDRRIGWTLEALEAARGWRAAGPKA
jgi:glycosyltransferase involved in cell wall biosynthesis